LSVTHIGEYIFSGKTMTSVTIPNSIINIGQNAFRRCTGLTSITIPASVTRIDQGAFQDCTNLTSVTFHGSNITIYNVTNPTYPAFPGDLVAKFNARTGGGAGVYTRPSGSNTWTRTGDAPAPVVTVNTSLNGVWEIGDTQITINGNTGVYSKLGSATGRTLDAVNKGYLKVGDQYWRNMTSTGNLTWSGQQNNITFTTSSPNVATGTQWVNCTITMSADGRTIEVNGTTYTRK
jgi:hypothetical protein